MLAKTRCIQHGAVFQMDCHTHFLAKSLVRYGECDAFENRRMIEDSEFDFRAIDVLAASKDHVFRSIHQVQESLFIKIANISGV